MKQTLSAWFIKLYNNCIPLKINTNDKISFKCNFRSIINQGCQFRVYLSCTDRRSEAHVIRGSLFIDSLTVSRSSYYSDYNWDFPFLHQPQIIYIREYLGEYICKNLYAPAVYQCFDYKRLPWLRTPTGCNKRKH